MSLIKWIALGVVAALVLLFIFLPVVAWILVGLVLLILAVVLFVPVGADVAYIGGEFRLAARVDGFALQLIPKKPPDPNKPPPKKKPKKEKKKKEPPPEAEQKEAEPKPKRKFNFTKEEIFELVKKVLNGLGKFGKLTVRKFMLHYVAAGEDPYDTAMTFNYVNAALSTLAPICAKKFNITGNVDVWTDVDFAADRMKIDAELSITLRLAQIVHVALAIGVGALGVLIRHKLRVRKEQKLARQNGEDVNNTEEQTDSIDNEIQAEERNDLHG